jgi:hypothetical protein
MGEQALMQMAGEQPDAVGPGVVAEEMAGHADLVTEAAVKLLLIKPGPVLYGLEYGLAARWLLFREVIRHHGEFCGQQQIAADWDSVISARCTMGLLQRCKLLDAWCASAGTDVPGGPPSSETQASEGSPSSRCCAGYCPVDAARGSTILGNNQFRSR